MKPRRIKVNCLVFGLGIYLVSQVTLGFPCRKAAAYSMKEKARVRLPIGLPKSLWRNRIPSDNRMNPEKIELGKSLYFDKRLSIDRTVSCATCHDPAIAFTDSNSVAVGAGAQQGSRNSPTLLNSMFNEDLFWDGRAHSLEEQIIFPLMSSFEMGMISEEQLISRVSSVPEYRRWFKEVFGSEGIDIRMIAKAIAAYERTLLSGNSPFDRFIASEKKAITESQARGWELFKGKARCIDCHSFGAQSPFFTDSKFHNTGVAASDRLFESFRAKMPASKNPELSGGAALTFLVHSEGVSELGRFAVTLKQDDIGAFKTPTLRDIELTSPYMHDGSFKTLIDVVRFYNRGGNPNSHLDQRMHPLNLTDRELNDLVEFMRALTSDDVLKLCQTTKPQNRNPVRLPN